MTCSLNGPAASVSRSRKKTKEASGSAGRSTAHSAMHRSTRSASVRGGPTLPKDLTVIPRFGTGWSSGTPTEAAAAILRSLGYGIQLDADEYRPGELLVSAREPGPHWTDPAVPPLAGSAGYSPGVRVRLLTGEFAGHVTTVVSATYGLSVPGPLRRYSVKHPNSEGDLDVAPEDVTLADDDT